MITAVTNRKNVLAAQSRKNEPELAFWEEKLAMKIQGVRQDLLRIGFTHINEDDWDQEYTFDVDLSSRDYKGKPARLKM